MDPKIQRSDNSVSLKQELVVQYVELLKIKKYERNPKTHPKKQIVKLMSSMRVFGVVTPILVDENFCIIAGHCRLEALIRLGYKLVPIIMLKHLTKDQVRAYRLADNRIAEEGEYDPELLKIELQELVLSDTVVITDTAFDIYEIDEIIIDGYGEIKERPDNDDEAPDLQDISQRVKPGDVYRLGEHILICGDSLDEKTYRHLLGKDKARIVLSDPPYNVPVDGHICGKGKTKHEEFAMASGEMSDEEFEHFVNTFMTNLVKFSIDGSLHYLFIDWRGLRIFLNSGHKNYSELKNIGIWNKLHGGMGSFYRSQFEACCVFKNGTAPHINNVELGKNGRYRTNVWNHHGVSATNPKSLELLRLHPTCKPVGLLHEVLLDASAPGDIVLDCFGGSGSTLLACERAKRKARLIEISPKYCDVTLYRWGKLTGETAELIKNIKEDQND